MNQDYPAICQESLYTAALQKSHLLEFCTAAFCKEALSGIGKASPAPSSASGAGTTPGNLMAGEPLLHKMQGTVWHSG